MGGKFLKSVLFARDCVGLKLVGSRNEYVFGWAKVLNVPVLQSITSDNWAFNRLR